MRCAGRWIGSLAAFAAFALAAGCAAHTGSVQGPGGPGAAGTRFVYKPDPAAPSAPQLPAKVAVHPFEDGTENFTLRGSRLGPGHYNLAKTGISGIVDALTPELWGKSFADDLASSGRFREVRFAYGAADVKDEEYVVEGVVKKAYAGISFEDTHTFLISFRATKRSDGKVVWEKEVLNESRTPRDIAAGCGTRMTCVAERSHAFQNRRMVEIFSEAREDLIAKLLPPVGGAGSAVPGSSGPPAGESVEQLVDRILKGK